MIADGDELYRRIFRYWVTSEGRISSAAYKEKKRLPRGSLSVDVARLTTPQECLGRGVAGQLLISVEVSVPRSLGLDVIHDPTEGNPAHALISGSFSAEICDRLASESDLIVSAE